LTMVDYRTSFSIYTRPYLYDVMIKLNARKNDIYDT